MMKRIYKYTIPAEPGKVVEINFPSDILILAAKMQHGKPTFWGVTDSDCQFQRQCLLCVMFTGQDIPEEMNDAAYYGMDTTEDGLVWHFLAKPRFWAEGHDGS